MKNLLCFTFFLLFGMAGCPKPSPTPIPPNPPGPVDPQNPYVVDSSVPEKPHEFTCAELCKHMLDLSCPAARSTPNGATCLDVCQNVMTSGIISWNLACRSTAISCAAIDACK